MASDAAPTSVSLASFPEPISVLVCGASRGIGHAFTSQLLRDPAVKRVFAVSRRGSSQRPGEAEADLHSLSMDVTDEASVADAAAEIAAITDRLDLIINCAGLLHDGESLRPEKQLADVDPQTLARSFAVNATGPLLIAKHMQRLIPRTERAVFASLSARVGSIGDNRLGGWYAYRAAKAAQNMIVRNLSIELRRRARGVICVALHPGTVDTDLSRPFQRGVPAHKLFTPELAAAQLLEVIDALTESDNGKFFAYDGQPIEW